MATLTSLLECYKEGSFEDSTDFKKFLMSEESSKANIEFELINKIVDDITFIRFRAEEDYGQNQYKVYSKKRALPIPWDYIEDELTKKIRISPPRRIITTIAQKHFSLLKKLTKSLKANLQRKREKVHLSAVQQIDSYCIRWLTKQPGRTEFEKAGNSQKIYAVVRKENIDTLENQVLKDFLKRIIPVAARYLKKYQKGYPNNTMVIAVKALENFCKAELNSSAFKSISNLKNSVIPNYTLQYHPMYSIIWELYRLLIHQTQLAELVWKSRYNLFAEYFILNATTFSNGKLTDESPVFYNEAWITFLPENGQFFTQTSFFNLFTKSDKSIFEMKMATTKNRMPCLKISKFSRLTHKETTYVPVYIPSSFKKEIVLPNDGNIYVIFNASSSTIKGHYVSYSDNFDYEGLI